MNEYDAAAEQAKEDVEAQAARAAHEVAKAEVEDSEYANRRAPGAIAPTELRRQQLTAERAGLQIKVAEMEFQVAGHTARAQRAKADVIDYDVVTRKIVAPFAGLIAERYRQEGEWVQAGDPVLRIVQMDKLRVKGYLRADRFAPHEIEGCRAEVLVHLPGGGSQKVDAVISYVSQEVSAGNEYDVWAEIDNIVVVEREGRTFWLIRPGMSATMIIDLTQRADE
jgi:macrolide-specific efflux system membrane fusion protein